MWIRTGTVDVTNASAIVVAGAAATKFETEQVLPGYLFMGPDGRSYEVLSVQSEIQLTLAEPYAGATAANQAYRVAQLVAAANATVLTEVLELLQLFRTSVDLNALRIGSPTVEAAFAFLGALASFENAAGLTVRLSKGAAGDTLALEFATGGAGKVRIGSVGNNNLVFQYYNTLTAAWVTVITINAGSGAVTIAGLPSLNMTEVKVYQPATGTADAIEAELIGPTASLHLMRATAANTGPATFKGRPLLDKDGAPLAAGAVQPGITYLLLDNTVDYRIVMAGVIL